MRAEGSIKNLTTGFTEVDKTRTPEAYMKSCVNFRNDAIDGLTRRPPARLIRPTINSNYNPETDAIVPFVLGNDEYWLWVSSTGGTFDLPRMAVYNSEGVQLTLDSSATTYWAGIRGPEDVELVTRGDTVYCLNRRRQVEVIADSGPIDLKRSMVIVSVAPRVYSKIRIDWEYLDGTQSYIDYEVGQDYPGGIGAIEDPADVDTGTNTIAKFIAADIAAKVIADGQGAKLQIAVKGSCIVFYRRKTIPGPDAAEPWFSQVAVSDGNNNAIYSINGSVETLGDLPKYSHKGALLTVSPDPTEGRGKVYMRAESVLDVLPKPTLTTDSLILDTAGKLTYSGGAWNETQWAKQYIYSGYDRTNWLPGGESIGYMTEPTLKYWDAGLAQVDVLSLVLFFQAPVNDTTRTRVTFVTSRPNSGNFVLPVTCKYLEAWSVAGDQTRTYQVFMSRTDATISGGRQVDSYEGWIDNAAGFIEGAKYRIYRKDLNESFDPVPEVRWVEDSAPGEPTLLNATTMPHALFRNEVGHFTFENFNATLSDETQPMVRRAAGDNESNPMPTFVGKAIDDVATFQGRFAMLSEDSVYMSVTNQVGNWFRGTVAQLLPSSPIAIKSTTTRANSLRHFVPHNNDLFVMGPYGQFKLYGDTALTPENAALPLTSSYETIGSAKPQVIGQDVYFPTSYGWSFGVSRYSAEIEDSRIHYASAMADHTIGQLWGTCTQITAAKNLGVVVCRGILPNVLYVMEFYRSDEGPGTHPSWAMWTFDEGMSIQSIQARNDYFDIMCWDGEGNNRLSLYRLDLYNERKFFSDEGDIYLDGKHNQYVQADGVTVNWPTNMPILQGELQVVGAAQGPYASQLLPGRQVGDHNVVLDEPVEPGTLVTVGVNFPSSVILPDIDIKDEAGKIMTTAKLRVRDYQVTLTGHLKYEFVPPDDSFEGMNFQEYKGLTVGVPQTVTDDVVYERGTWGISHMQAGDYGNAWLYADTHIGCTIHEIEWRGTYFKAGRRF